MELEKNTANAFIDYLKRHGYPEDRIVTEWGSGKYLIDIVVLDEDRLHPVAIYEVKGNKNKGSLIRGMKQLKTFINSLGYPVESGLVFRKETYPFFEFYNISWEQTEYLENESLKNHLEIDQNIEPLTYENIKNSASPKIYKSIQEKKVKRINEFKVVSWSLALVTTVLLVLEILGKFSFSTERLIVYGSIIVLIILPFFSEIKLGDVLLKNETKKKD